MCHWPSGSPACVWLLCRVPCPPRSREQERNHVPPPRRGQPWQGGAACVWSTITPGAYFLLPSLLEVLQGISRRALPWGWEASGGAVRVRRMVTEETLVLLPGCCH